MTFPQEDYFSMMYSVKNICEKYQPTWTSIAAFAASYNLLATKFPLIEQNRDAQMLEITGVTTDKNNKRQVMVEKSAFMQNRLQSMANVTNNPELLNSVKYTPTKMKMARNTEIVGICNTILSRANANAAALVNYGVTAALITELQAAIANYSTTLSKPKTAITQSKTATENLVKYFKEADDILTKRMDLDIELFKVSKPEFYSQYQSARIVTSTGRNKISLLGNVIIAGSGEPLKGVTLTFVPDNNSMLKSATKAGVNTLVKKSTDKGNYRISNLPEGTYIVTAKKIGYKDQNVMIIVTKGETTYLKIEMEKN